MKKATFLWVTLFGAILLFYAFTKREIPVVAHGKVSSQGNELHMVKICVEKNDMQMDCQYHDFSLPGQGYYLNFNAPEGDPIYFYYQKEGYSTFRYYERFYNNQKSKQLPEFQLLKLYDVRQSGGLVTYPAYEPELMVFESASTQSKSGHLNPTEISYFSRIEKATGNAPHKGFAQKTSPKEWYSVDFTMKDGTKYNGVYLPQ